MQRRPNAELIRIRTTGAPEAPLPCRDIGSSEGTAVREISVVSLNEIAVKQTRGKLTFSNADAMAGVADLRLRILP